MHANLRTGVQNVAYFQILQAYVSNRTRRKRTPEPSDLELCAFNIQFDGGDKNHPTVCMEPFII